MFYPVQPCRIADTRVSGGSFGGPQSYSQSEREFAVMASPCGIPSSAKAYSLNMTAVPIGPLSYLTTWPSGGLQPHVSTLNSNTGTVVANAALVPAGTSGSIRVYATQPTHLVIDINGYFAPPGGAGAQSFYPIAPCRILDTRLINGPLGGPEMAALQTRNFQVTSSPCGLPSTSQSYSLNATVVPPGPFGYLTLWPSGTTRPFVSTLNALDGSITSNAAILPAGSLGTISAFVDSRSHLILDISGYFAP
jgi:hypothetical protein